MKQFVLIGENGKYVDIVDPVGRIYPKDGKLMVEQAATIDPHYTYEFPLHSKFDILECYYDDDEYGYVYEDEKRARELGLIR